MHWYEIKLKVHTALGTPLSADTLFGHLCWALRYQQGEPTLQTFLNDYTKGTPPLLLSDPFPQGFWPMPHLPRLTKTQQDKLEDRLSKMTRQELLKHIGTQNQDDEELPVPIAANQPNAIELFDILKWLYKLRWLPDKALRDLAGRLSTSSIFNWFFDDQNSCGKPNLPGETIVPHNTINRLTGTTGDKDSFFFTREFHIHPADPPIFHLLAASPSYTADQLQQWFTDALTAGYGKYKFRGKGKVTVESVSPFQPPAVSRANAALLLAACTPAADDPADGFWKLQTKFGKLGGDWAVGPHPSGIHNPFKKPLIMLTAGSILKTDSPRPFYGRLVDDIHRNFDEVRHYAIAPALPVFCDDTEVL